MCPNLLRVFIMLALFPLQNLLKVQMTKVICTITDKTFSQFDVCELQASAPNQSPTLTVQVQFFQLPLTNLHLQMEFSRLNAKSSVNILNNTWDVCNFLKNINKHRALRIFYDVMKEYSNINHTCPYNHDIRVVNFAPKIDRFAIPLPEGKYKLKNTYIVDNKDRLAIALIFTIKN